MSFSSVAEYRRTPIDTRPNETAPFQMARIFAEYGLSLDSGRSAVVGWSAGLVPCRDDEDDGTVGGHRGDVHERDLGGEPVRQRGRAGWPAHESSDRSATVVSTLTRGSSRSTANVQAPRGRSCNCCRMGYAAVNCGSGARSLDAVSGTGAGATVCATRAGCATRHPVPVDPVIATAPAIRAGIRTRRFFASPAGV